ncbi:MAG: hypothetical protein C3F17_05835 [Bradyrhizobiaceae bacterium]|nr:MAG: hypothetical protein C3F17_05835 [Bradyrhizobiaceae bacterium]
MLAGLATAGMLGSGAAAETRIFIIANNADGYGVDRCLASGEGCGRAVATAYCQSQQFDKAVSYRKVAREEITGAIPARNDGCKAGVCAGFVAIECRR